MRVLDPGHTYELDTLDGGVPQVLRFVKREGPRYPGNVGVQPGTIMQDVLRALIDRAQYVNAQIPCAETEAAVGCMRSALLLMEVRAKRVKGKALEVGDLEALEAMQTCARCGHIACDEHA